jgi:hypothetical protein
LGIHTKLRRRREVLKAVEESRSRLFCFVLFLVVLVFELKFSHLLGRCSTHCQLSQKSRRMKKVIGYRDYISLETLTKAVLDTALKSNLSTSFLLKLCISLVYSLIMPDYAWISFQRIIWSRIADLNFLSAN